MQGAQYAYKIAYNDINSLYLLAKPHGGRPELGRSAIVIALEKPIRQGNQKYQYLVMESHKLNTTIDLNLSNEDIQNEYSGLSKQLNMPLCNLIAKVMKELSQKKVCLR